MDPGPCKVPRPSSFLSLFLSCLSLFLRALLLVALVRLAYLYSRSSSFLSTSPSNIGNVQNLAGRDSLSLLHHHHHLFLLLCVSCHPHSSNTRQFLISCPSPPRPPRHRRKRVRVATPVDISRSKQRTLHPLDHLSASFKWIIRRDPSSTLLVSSSLRRWLRHPSI